MNGAVDSPDVVEWLIEPVDFNADAVADTTDLELLVEEVNN